MVRCGRSLCGDLGAAERREWLLTNGRGGMARLGVDLGHVKSKYDCVLGANLHPDYPVDRQVLVKRLRAWISADGFVTALDLQNLAGFEIGQPAMWNFVAEAGDSRTVELRMTADMLAESNTTIFTFARQPGTRAADLPARFDVRIIVRVDIEVRSRNGAKASPTLSNKVAARPASATPTVRAGLNFRWKKTGA